MAVRSHGPRQVSVPVDEADYSALEAPAREERRSVPEEARQLLLDALQQRRSFAPDGTPSGEIAALATAGGAFDWLKDEPDLYDDSSGEPL